MSLSSGKAPPNLPPGVPPLLPNPYIMAPGLLHAYPVGSCQGQVKLTRTIRALLVLHRVQVILLTHFPLYLSLRCMAMMTYRCCRHGYPWWVCDESGDTNSRFIASWPGVKKTQMCLSLSLIHQDYYSIPFATPTTALTGREGNLTSNPYSGEPSWKSCVKWGSAPIESGA